MRQFPQSQLLSTLQANGELNAGHVDEMAQQIAHFHTQAPQVPAAHYQGTPEAVMDPVRQNFEQIRPFLSDKADLLQLEALQAWAEASFTRLKPLFEQRKAQGFIRECHGDIHLGNATMIDGKVVIFDCIEFNEDFRWIDVASELAFTYMDLLDHRRPDLAAWLLDAWLHESGDFSAVPVLRFYSVYKALVRAKVADLPLSFAFDDTMALPGGQKISDLPAITVEARVAKSGQAQSASGDLFGSVPGVKPGSQGIKVVIDQVQP